MLHPLPIVQVSQVKNKLSIVEKHKNAVFLSRRIELNSDSIVGYLSKYLYTLFNFVPLIRLENKAATFDRVTIVKVAMVVWTVTESLCLVKRSESIYTL